MSGLRDGFYLVALFVFACVPNRCYPQDAGATKDVSRCEENLIIRLSAPQTTFNVGHPVPLRVEIQNCSQRDLWIAISYEEEFAGGFPVNFPLLIRAIHRRRVRPGGYTLHESPFGRPGEWWIRLPPGYLYGRDVLVTQYQSAFVNTPGKYEVTASYAGIARPRSPMKPPADAHVFPPESSEVFTGRIQSNPISIEILPSATSKP